MNIDMVGGGVEDSLRGTVGVEYSSRLCIRLSFSSLMPWDELADMPRTHVCGKRSQKGSHAAGTSKPVNEMRDGLLDEVKLLGILTGWSSISRPDDGNLKRWFCRAR